MIGIVVVSHSPRLAESVVELALAMLPGDRPAIAIAAGAGEDVIGTDAVRVSEAIGEVASEDGVLVLMDLGSAVLSAEMALEFLDTDVPVRLSAAPFVEGVIAAVVRAASGSSLDEVADEARGALSAKLSQLGEEAAEASVPAGDPGAASEEPGSTPSETSATVVAEERLINPAGLHARPAAALVGQLAALDATVTVSDVTTGRGPVSAASPIGLIGLGARQGNTLRIEGTGPQADEAVELLRAAVADGFGELEGDGADAPASPLPAAAVPDAAVPDTPATAGRTTAPTSTPASAHAPDSASTPEPSVDAFGILSGIGVSPGRAAGPVLVMPAPLEEPAQTPALTEDARPAELARIETSALDVATALRERAHRASGAGSAVLEATALLAVDPGVLDAAKRLVSAEGTAAPLAVWQAFTDAAKLFTAQGGLLAERAADLRDVRGRIVSALLGRAAPGLPDSADPYVLVATDLAPADTALLDPALCLALVTEEGGPTSHTAIIARSLGVPAVVAVRGASAALRDGGIVLVDGAAGTVQLDPTANEIAVAQRPARVLEFDGHGSTADGHEVALLANIGAAADAEAAAAAGAHGVGLFRTEFGFLGRTEAPSVAEQVAAYRTVFHAFPDRKVVVRTLDAGADKPLPFLTPAHEENPALGVRGYRTAWQHPEVLEDQLLAIADAAAAERAEVWVMAPMIATVAEAADFAAACARHGLDTPGVMVETPAMAVTASRLGSVVDFVSLGTNDLAQYTMAADRVDGALAALNDPWQPAVLRMIGLAVEGAHAAGIPAGVCGEAASDPALAAVLVGLGVSSLSMAPRALAGVGAALATVTLAECRALASAALDAADAGAARVAVRTSMPVLADLGI